VVDRFLGVGVEDPALGGLGDHPAAGVGDARQTVSHDDMTTSRLLDLPGHLDVALEGLDDADLGDLPGLHGAVVEEGGVARLSTTAWYWLAGILASRRKAYQRGSGDRAARKTASARSTRLGLRRIGSPPPTGGRARS
jgi:hypothetical protein